MQNKKFGLLAVIVAVVVIIGLVVAFVLPGMGIGGKSPEKIADAFMKAMFDADGKAMVNLLPDDVVDALMEESGMTKKEVIEELNYMLEEAGSYFTMAEEMGVKISYEIGDSESVKGDELDDIKDSYDELDVKVSAAKKVEVKIIAKYEGEKETETMDIYVVKIGGSWYLDASSMDF